MSTASVSSPKKRTNKQNPAKWDDEKTKILLEVFAYEIDEGNRTAGVFSKQGWINILQKFNSKIGLSYNKEQLKNRQDNLQREYSCWEKFISKKTGLGWDNDRRTLSAPDEWWEEKAKVDPTILKYKDAGPLHLDLLQKVFGGTTANEFYSYIPDLFDEDPLLNVGDTIEEINTAGNGDQPINLGADFDPVGCDESVERIVPSPGQNSLQGPKRQRLSSGSCLSSTDRFHNSMENITSTLRVGIERYEKARSKSDEEAITYRESFMLLKGVPRMSPRHPMYVKAIRILVDKMHRVAFTTMLEDGVDVLMDWLESFE